MRPETSHDDFAARLGRVADDLSLLTVPAGLAAMFEFYRDVRADGCESEDNGDILLFQWGSYDVGEGERFMIDITRQFIDSALEDDDAISQLSLTFLHLPDGATPSVGKGDMWCRSSTELASFERIVLAHPAVRCATSLKPSRVTLEYSPV